MESAGTKIAGWFLLFLGLVIIIWILYFSYQIFTGEKLVPQVFKLEEKEATTDSGSSNIQNLIEDQLGKIIQQQISDWMPSNTLTNFLNLMTWSIFAGIAIFAGSKIAGLGINLLK